MNSSGGSTAPPLAPTGDGPGVALRCSSTACCLRASRSAASASMRRVNLSGPFPFFAGPGPGASAGGGGEELSLELSRAAAAACASLAALSSSSEATFSWVFVVTGCFESAGECVSLPQLSRELSRPTHAGPAPLCAHTQAVDELGGGGTLMLAMMHRMPHAEGIPKNKWAE